MPKRQSIVRIPTPEVQGEGSWVDVRRPTVQEVIERIDEPVQEDLTRSQEYKNTVTSMLPYIIDWNWVDDDGRALPTPKDQPDIWKALTDSEVECLLDALYGSGRRRKN